MCVGMLVRAASHVRMAANQSDLENLRGCMASENWDGLGRKLLRSMRATVAPAAAVPVSTTTSVPTPSSDQTNGFVAKAQVHTFSSRTELVFAARAWIDDWCAIAGVRTVQLGRKKKCLYFAAMARCVNMITPWPLVATSRPSRFFFSAISRLDLRTRCHQA